MKFPLIAIAAVLPWIATAQARTPTLQTPQKMALTPLQVPSLSLQICGGFAGKSHGFSILAGTADIGTGPLQILTLPETGGSAWKACSQTAPRWAASAQWNDTVIVAGGQANGKLSARVVAFQAGPDGTLSENDLTDLPMPLAGAGAAVIRDRLYIVGGISSVEKGTLENALWSLDLKNQRASWQREAPLPGAPRAFAAVTQQYEALCVFGGLEVAASGGKPVAGRETWLFRATPPEASQRKGWTRFADVPRPVFGATAFPVGQAAVAVAGGGGHGDGSLFPSESTTQPGAPTLLFHTLTDAWCLFDRPLGTTFFQVTTERNTLEGKTLLFSNRPSDPALRVEEFAVIRTARSLVAVDYIVIVCYFCFISMIGFLAARKQKSSADFSLAGRNVPWWVAGISMFATGASAISLMSIPALAFASNLVFLFPIIISVVSYFVQAHTIYPLLRRMEITSTYEYLERRFNRTLRLIASAQCILFQTFGRAAVVLVLPSLAISATTGIPTWKSVLLMGCITTLYTALGGFNAVVWTDVFQGLLKFFAPLFMIAFCIFSLPGGPREFVEVGLAHHKFDFALLTWDATLPAVWVLIINVFLATTIMQAGDQPVIQRVFSAPDKEVRRVSAIFTACGILIAVVVNVLGIAIYAYFHAYPGKLDPLSQNDKIMPLFVIQALPHGVVGMVIAAIFASAMTTVASSMNSTATVFTEDFFLRFKPDASDKLRLRVLRATCYLVGAIAVCMALFLSRQNTKSFMQVWYIVSALLGGGIVGVYSLGMFTRRANGFGAVCGAIASIFITALVQFKTPLHWQTLTPIAILSCMGVGYFLSLFAPQKKDIRGLTIYPSGDVAQAAPMSATTVIE